MATFYLDYEGGNDGNDGTTFANRWKTFTSGATAARIAPGDTIRVMGSPDPTSLGINATWTNKSGTITLASAKNVTITNCNSAWTAATNVTATASTTRREGTNSASLAIAAGFTTGKCAYFGLGGAQNYSGYQGITLWYQANATVAASTLSIRLCSDTTGDTTVDTLVLPALGQANQWLPVYIDTGGALGSSIQSIALYADADPGTVTVLLDNISTVLAAGNDALNLTTWIGKNSGGEPFNCLRVIDGTSLTIDTAPTQTTPWTVRGYSGTSETVTAYICKPIPTDMAANGTTVHIINDQGSAGSYITFSGGWNRTDMSTKSLQATRFDGRTGFAIGIGATAGFAYIALEDITIARYQYGLQMGGTSSNWTLHNFYSGHMDQVGWNMSANSGVTSTGVLCFYNNQWSGWNAGSGDNHTHNDVRCLSNGTNGAQYGLHNTGYLWKWKFTTLTIKNNASYGLASNNASQCYSWHVDSQICNDNGASGMGAPWESGGGFADDWRIRYLETKNNSAYGIYAAGGKDIRVYEWVSSGNTSGGMIMNGYNAPHSWKIIKASSTDTTPITSYNNSSYRGRQRLELGNYGGTTGDHRTYCNGTAGIIQSETGGNRHTASGIGWAMKPQNASYWSADFPLDMTLALLPVNANKLVTVRCYMKRTNTGLTGILICKGNQIAGVTSDVTATVTAAADTWQELEITFTPTEIGVVEILAQAYGGTTYTLYIDDMTIIQAT